jgi:DNA-binding response OmpR family regulator
VTDERIRILVVDDDPALLDTVREYLENPRNRYVVETASRGSEALWMVARARPHVVILDVEMPGMTGVQVLASLRSLDPTIPVIMLTANTDSSVAAETLKLGAASYAPKPLDLRYLDHLIATFAAKPRGGSSA